MPHADAAAVPVRKHDHALARVVKRVVTAIVIRDLYWGAHRGSAASIDPRLLAVRDDCVTTRRAKVHPAYDRRQNRPLLHLTRYEGPKLCRVVLWFDPDVFLVGRDLVIRVLVRKSGIYCPMNDDLLTRSAYHEGLAGRNDDRDFTIVLPNFQV